MEIVGLGILVKVTSQFNLWKFVFDTVLLSFSFTQHDWLTIKFIYKREK